MQSRLASCLHHLPLLSILSPERRHIISLMLEAIPQLANIRSINFTLLARVHQVVSPGTASVGVVHWGPTPSGYLTYTWQYPVGGLAKP